MRTKLLLCLEDNEVSAGQLENVLKIRSSTILHSIKDMIDSGIVYKKSTGYALTNIGQIQALLLDRLINALKVLDEHKDFWLTHDMSGIPDDLLVKIGMLGDAQILKGDAIDLLKTQEFFVKELVSSKQIRGVSPIIVPEYPFAIAAAIKNGAKADLILTDKIIDIVVKEHSEILKELLNQENFNLYCIKEDVRLAFTVTDRLLSLGLYRKDGGYDITCDLNCIGEQPRLWGVKLFEYYVLKSRPFTRDDFDEHAQ
ncbi:MAG: winged helix-turn-helix domain-containing protein [Methanosarcinales archaeon]|nr:winged helix-turn-helix domain-containing protein [Methanosarcinales archaeon]